MCSLEIFSGTSLNMSQKLCDASEFRGVIETQHESTGLSEWTQKAQIHLKPFTKAAEYSRHKQRILKGLNTTLRVIISVAAAAKASEASVDPHTSFANAIRLLINKASNPRVICLK